MANYRVVVVEWDDANFEDEYGVQDSAKLTPVRLYTAGFLVAETDEAVVLAMTVPDESEDDAEQIVTEQIVIPWGMIQDWYDA